MASAVCYCASAVNGEGNGGVNEGRARAEGSRACSSSSQPARGVVRASRAHGGHAAAAI